ncbi:MAG: ComEC/Rec2 family competence protein [Rhodospirillaceae bacterium]|nr:ComEC/Rec2 family competence protein [Rhodospirillaceae bacterium]
MAEAVPSPPLFAAPRLSMWLRGRRESLREEALRQLDAGLLWLVTAFGAGIAAFFTWPVDPWPWVGPALGSLAVAIVIWRRRLDGVVFAAAMVLAVGAGLTAAQVRVSSVDAPVITQEIGPLEVRGRVIEVEREPGRTRVILDRVRFESSVVSRKPVRIRLSLPSRHGAPRVGDVIAVDAVLRPPERPVVPGGFEYQRYLFFERIGALGYTLQPWELKRAQAEEGMSAQARQTIENLRRDISDRILAVIPGDAGAVAVALVTGEQSLISEPLQEAYRVSGLAHLLSISGVHMSLLAAAVFVLVRRTLALWPAVALRLDIKKIAAWAALAATSFYVLISGMSVPAVRAFIMVAVVMIAVLVDRRAISLRSVAMAAVVLLALYPEAVVGPSFQMSFMAVIALVALYERVSLRPHWRGPDGEVRVMRAVLIYVAALVVTDLVAGSVTSLFAAYHFNRLPAYSLIANLVAAPLTGLWIMPTGLLALALMPLGWDAPVLALMGAGVDAVNGTAIAVAGWPGAEVHVPPMAPWAMAGAAAGLIVVCLWRGTLRWIGVIPLVVAMMQPWLASKPDVVMDESGRVVAVSDSGGRLALLPDRRDRFVRSVFKERYGASREAWPKPGETNPDLGLACDAAGCVLQRNDIRLTLAWSQAAVAEDCGVADVIVAPALFDVSCRSSRVIDRGDLWREGAHALYLGSGRLRVQTVEDETGDRLWSRQPRPRRRAETARTEDLDNAD